MVKIRDIFRLPSYDFEEILILRAVIESIIAIAEDTYPKEFSAFLKGKIRKKKLVITELVYQPYYAGNFSTLIRADLPMLHETYGTVHSHPGPSNRPSDADLFFFSKHGIINLIICMPYAEQSIRAYDKEGNELGFRIIDKFINH